MKSIFCLFFAIFYKVSRESSKNLAERFTKLIESTYLVTEKNETSKQSMGVRTLKHPNYVTTK